MVFISKTDHFKIPLVSQYRIEFPMDVKLSAGYEVWTQVRHKDIYYRQWKRYTRTYRVRKLIGE